MNSKSRGSLQLLDDTIEYNNLTFLYGASAMVQVIDRFIPYAEDDYRGALLMRIPSKSSHRMISYILLSKNSCCWLNQLWPLCPWLCPWLSFTLQTAHWALCWKKVYSTVLKKVWIMILRRIVSLSHLNWFFGMLRTGASQVTTDGWLDVLWLDLLWWPSQHPWLDLGRLTQFDLFNFF